MAAATLMRQTLSVARRGFPSRHLAAARRIRPLSTAPLGAPDFDPTTPGAQFSADELLALDRRRLWHPYTSATAPSPCLPVASASGVRLTLEDGRALVDGMSSWWAAVHGYAVPELDAAAAAQLGRMSHVMFGGLTHRPAVALGALLAEVTPAPLERSNTPPPLERSTPPGSPTVLAASAKTAPGAPAGPTPFMQWKMSRRGLR